MISIDNQSWISIHAYVVEDFKRTLISVNLEWVTKGCIMNNFTNMIWNLVKGFGGLFDHDLVIKVICCGANGAATFQGIKTKVITQLKEKSSPFCIHVHYVTHKTNLTTLTLSNMPSHSCEDWSIIGKCVHIR